MMIGVVKVMMLLRCDLCSDDRAAVHQRLMTTWLLTKTDDDVAVVQVMMLMQCTNDG